VLLVRGEEENPRGGKGVGCVELREMREKKEMGREKEGRALGLGGSERKQGKRKRKNKGKGDTCRMCCSKKKIKLSSSNKSGVDTWQWKITFYFKA
jgi:hypothetical protein